MLPWVLDHHVDEAAFLWRQRDRLALAPHVDLAELGRWDARLEAHLDALRLGGDDALHRCRASLDKERDAGEVFVTTTLAAERGDMTAIAAVLDLLSERRRLARPFVAALAWTAPDRAAPVLDRLLAPTCPTALQTLGLAAAGAARRDPGPTLVQMLYKDD